MTLENGTLERVGLTGVDSKDGTKLDANRGEDVDMTSVPLAPYVLPSSQEGTPQNDKKRPAESFPDLPMPTPSPFLQPMSAAKKTKTQEQPSFEDMTTVQLKDECIIRGLKVRGKKTELVERLQNPAVAAANRPKGGFSANQVDAALKLVGYKDPKNGSQCVKRGIQKGLIELQHGLDQVMATWICVQCHETVEATLRHCLEQPDYGGDDDGEENFHGALQCQGCQIGQFVTNMCSGGFEVTIGKFHNHCTACPGLGKCLGDYREIHCEECQGHFFTGLSGFPCPCSERRGDMDGMLCGMGATTLELMFGGLSDDEYSEINEDDFVNMLLDDIEEAHETQD